MPHREVSPSSTENVSPFGNWSDQSLGIDENDSTFMYGTAVDSTVRKVRCMFAALESAIGEMWMRITVDWEITAAVHSGFSAPNMTLASMVREDPAVYAEFGTAMFSDGGGPVARSKVSYLLPAGSAVGLPFRRPGDQIYGVEVTMTAGGPGNSITGRVYEVTADAISRWSMANVEG